MNVPRPTIIRLAAATLALTVIASIVMLQFDWNGVAASAQAGPIDTLLDVTIVISAFVFAVVGVLFVYAIWKYRAKPGDESDGEPIHGNTKLEIAWTAIPTIIVLFLAGYSWVVLEDIEAREPDRMHVNVVGQQFAFTFHYPEEDVRTTELTVPVDRQIEFQLDAIDVIHSFWVPEWRMKQDLVPGITTDVIVTPTEEGTYSLVCAELCGFGHATMRAFVHVVSEQEYDEWIAEQEPDGAPDPLRGTGADPDQAADGDGDAGEAPAPADGGES